MYVKQYGSVIVQAPTGSGKSHIINMTVKKILAQGKIPLVISDNSKIHGQLIAECSGIKIDSTVKYLQIFNGNCYVAMAQSLVNRNLIIEQFHKLYDQLVVIVDECHRNTPTRLIQQINPCFLIGFSATPHYKWAKHLPLLYKSLIQGPQIKQLIKDGFMCHYRHIIRTGAILDELELRGMDYSQESQYKVFGTKEMYDGIFEDLPQYHKHKTVIYVSSIKMCEEMYGKLLDHGYKACRYHSKLDNPDYELSKFTVLNMCDICVSVSSLTLGWDYRPIDLVVYWRKTTSLPLYLQIGGRGFRICTAEDAKYNFSLNDYEKPMLTVLDYGGNYETFGDLDLDRDWASLWQDPKKKRKISMYAGVEGSKHCPICQMLLPIAAHSCGNCGYMYPEDQIKLIEGQLVEVSNSLQAIKNKMVGDLNAKELSDYSKLHNKKQYAIRVARRKEQDEPGFIGEFAKEMGYKNSWVEKTLRDLPDKKIIYFNQIIR